LWKQEGLNSTSMKTIFHILRIPFSNLKFEMWMYSICLFYFIFYGFKISIFFCSFIFEFTFQFLKKDMGLGFNSYEHLHSMIGIKLTTAQTTSTLCLVLHN